MSELTIKSIMDQTPGHFDAEAAGDMDCVIQMNFTGEEAADYHMVIQNKTVQVHEGSTSSSDMSMTVDSEVYKGIISGEVNAMSAFMQGKVKVSGDMSLAMKMQTIFTR
jgi:putative sterol carrier protein